VRLRLAARELAASFLPGGGRWARFDYWASLALLLAALWVRVYVHYVGQWLLLRALRVPVYGLTPLPFSAVLAYDPGPLPLETLVALVAAGPLAVCLVFAGVVALQAVARALLRCVTAPRRRSGLSTWMTVPSFFSSLPAPLLDVLCRLTASLGLAAALDPLLVLLVDAAAGRYDCAARYAACSSSSSWAAGSTSLSSSTSSSGSGGGPSLTALLGAGVAGGTTGSCECSAADAWVLPLRFASSDGSPAAGIVLTALLYAGLTAAAVLLLLYYLLSPLHRGGVLADAVGRRCASVRYTVALPHDLSLTRSELLAAVQAATAWRGGGGGGGATTMRVVMRKEEVAAAAAAAAGAGSALLQLGGSGGGEDGDDESGTDVVSQPTRPSWLRRLAQHWSAWGRGRGRLPTVGHVYILLKQRGGWEEGRSDGARASEARPPLVPEEASSCEGAGSLTLSGRDVAAPPRAGLLLHRHLLCLPGGDVVEAPPPLRSHRGTA
jgi:hypothetical protein